MVEGGSFGTFNQTAAPAARSGNFNYAFNIGHFRSTDTPVTPLDLLPPGRARNNDFYDNWTYSTKMGVDYQQEPVAQHGCALHGCHAEVHRPTTSPRSRSCPSRRAAKHPTVHQLYTRGETVLTLLDGASRTTSPSATPTTGIGRCHPSSPLGQHQPGRAHQVRLARRGHGRSGQTLMWDLESQTERPRDQRDKLRIDRTGPAISSCSPSSPSASSWPRTFGAR